MFVLLPPVAVQAAEPDDFENAKDKTLIVQCDDSSGSGFVCEMDGRRYFITNEHVIRGQKRVAVFFCDGRKLKLGRMEIARDADLVRFAVSSNQPAFKLAGGEPRMHEKVRVFGNSDGKGVVTYIQGRIIGIGPKELEVSAEFINGNSGSAVLNEAGAVVGVATYATRSFSPDDWVKADTRYSKVRRFALRLNGREWIRTDLKAHYRKVVAEEERERKEFGIYPQTGATFKSPSLRVNVQKRGTDVSYYVNGNITLGLSTVKGIKNPLVRVVMLLDGGKLMVMDAVADKPGGEYDFSYVPVYAYGMPKSSYVYNIGNGIAAYYLEGMSFHQSVAQWGARPGSGKNIEYFDRSSLLSGGFSIPRSISGVNPPKIVAYRLECWQNGSLAGVYNSMRPDTLNSKKIPVDWFVMGKYPRKFLYAERCDYRR